MVGYHRVQPPAPVTKVVQLPALTSPKHIKSGGVLWIHIEYLWAAAGARQGALCRLDWADCDVIGGGYDVKRSISECWETESNYLPKPYIDNKYGRLQLHKSTW